MEIFRVLVVEPNDDHHRQLVAAFEKRWKDEEDKFGPLFCNRCKVKVVTDLSQAKDWISSLPRGTLFHALVLKVETRKVATNPSKSEFAFNQKLAEFGSDRARNYTGEPGTMTVFRPSVLFVSEQTEISTALDAAGQDCHVSFYKIEHVQWHQDYRQHLLVTPPLSTGVVLATQIVDRVRQQLFTRSIVLRAGRLYDRDIRSLQKNILATSIDRENYPTSFLTPISLTGYLQMLQDDITTYWNDLEPEVQNWLQEYLTIDAPYKSAKTSELEKDVLGTVSI